MSSKPKVGDTMPSIYERGIADESAGNSYGYITTFVAGVIGMMILTVAQNSGTMLYRALSPGFVGLFFEALLGAAAVFAVYAMTAEISLNYGFADALAAFIVMCMDKTAWAGAYISPLYFRNWKLNDASTTRRFGAPVVKLFTEWASSILGAIVGASVLLGIFWIFPTSVTLMGQPEILPGVTDGSAILAEIVGGYIFRLSVLIAFNASTKRIMGHMQRSSIAAGGYFLSRLVTGYTIQSNFNFWQYLAAGIWAGVHVNCWIYILGELCSVALVLITYYFFLREGSSEIPDYTAPDQLKNRSKLNEKFV